MRFGKKFIPLTLCISCSAADASIVKYECNTFPEELGFERIQVYDPEAWIEEGWLFQHIDVGGGTGGEYDGDYDVYERELVSFAGSPFFIEWRLVTDAPNSEVDVRNAGAAVILLGGGKVPL